MTDTIYARAFKELQKYGFTTEKKLLASLEENSTFLRSQRGELASREEVIKSQTGELASKEEVIQ